MHDSNEATQMGPQNLINVSPTSKYQFSERQWKQYHGTHMVFKAVPAVKLHTKNVLFIYMA